MEPTTYRKVMARVVWPLTFLIILSSLDRVNVSFAALEMNADIGLDPADVRGALDSDQDVAEVTQEAEAAKEAGIQGVPMFIFGGKFAVSGAQAPEYLAEAIQRAAQAAGEAAE